MNNLKRSLKLRDLILLNIVAVYTPATLSQTMPLGRAGLLLWLVAILSFMLPYASALTDLARLHPREGGVYAWTRMAFGDFHGFICGWCYWVNTFLYVPSIFLGLASVAALLGGAQLNENKNLVVAVACGSLLLSACLHIVGLGQGKWLQNFGAFGRLAIAVGLLAAGLWRWFHPVSVESAAAVESLTALQSFALWPFVMNALVGLDLGSAMSEEADAPQNNIPRSLLIGGTAVALCYLLTYGATIAIGGFTNMGEPNVIYGHVRAVQSVLPPGATALAALIVLLELSGLLGSGAAWLAAPARIPFAIGLDHYLPAAFARVHPRFGTPYVALLTQAAVAIALIVATTYQASLNDAYLVLLGGSIVLVMVTYAYLFAAWWRLSERTLRVTVLSVIGLLAASLATVACFIPAPAVQDVSRFELNLTGSIAAMLIAGLALFLGARFNQKRGSEPKHH